MWSCGPATGASDGANVAGLGEGAEVTGEQGRGATNKSSCQTNSLCSGSSQKAGTRLKFFFFLVDNIKSHRNKMEVCVGSVIQRWVRKKV